jgi:fucose 4-O-acetylase-like acetyltransferase
MSKERLIELDLAKGFAILLVVIGHIADPGIEPLIVGNDFYFLLKKMIYSFHMPFFMFISGMIFFYSFKKIDNSKDFLNFTLKKAERLLLPFFLMGILIYFGKAIASQIIHVNNLHSTSFLDSFITLLTSPMESISRSLWFIYVLFEYYLIFTILLNISKNTRYLLLIGLLIYFIPVTQLFALDRFATYFIFFALGIYIMDNYNIFKIITIKYSTIFLIVFICSLYYRNYFELHEALLFYGLLSIPSLFSLFIKYTILNNKIFQVLAKYTFIIYLFNIIFIGLVLGFLLKLFPLNGVYLTLMLPVIISTGIIGPILLKKYIFNRISYLKKITN